MQPSGTGQREAIGGLVRRLVEAGHAPVVALQQTHDAPAGSSTAGITSIASHHANMAVLMTRHPGRPGWREDNVEELLRAFGMLRSDEERAAFLRDLCTLAEIQAMAHRLAAARLVAGCPRPRSPSGSAARRRRSRASPTGCVTARAATASCSTGWRGGAMTRRGLLRLALPSKGRLAEPATRLLTDAGIQFETTGRTTARARP